MNHHLSRFAFVGSYPPTPCGIATFTQSLRKAFVDDAQTQDRPITAGVIRLTDPTDEPASGDVAVNWLRGSTESLRQALHVANDHDIVVLQHEFGIFGGEDGDEVVSFANGCQVPLIVVLHTVLGEPTAHQKEIVEALIDASLFTVVQSQSALSRLHDAHLVDRSRVVVAPHGAVENFNGERIDLSTAGEPVLLSWGLLGPGKGIERVIRALAQLPEGVTPPTYLVAGRTHPKVVEREGEMYRNSLIALATTLGVADQVVFDDSYRSWQDLRTMVRSCDVVMLPYDSRDQVTSGVLVEALASGRPVIATAFPHAVEALASGAGLVVEHDDTAAMARAIGCVLTDHDLRDHMQHVARIEGAALVWPRVARKYWDEIRRYTGVLEVAR